MAEDQQDKRSVIKEFKLSSLAVGNRTTVFVVLVILVLAGIVSYSSMPKATFPDLVIPQIYVGTAYPGNSPVDIEKLITRPLEKEINTIGEVDKITSTSIQGYSTVLAEFDFEVPPEEALTKIKDAVDKAMSDPDFPKDLPADPNVFEVDFAEMPILNVNLSGDFSQDQLLDYAEYLEDKIEAVPEISKVDIRGVQEKEVKIDVDVHKMEALEIGFRDVESAITSENMTISGGDLLVDRYRRTVRVVGDFTSISEIGDVIVKQEKFNIVYLKDIADVSFEYEERSSYAREFSKPVVMLDVVKRAGENILEATDQIKEIIADAQENKFPENLELSLSNDMSQMTRDQVSNLENSIISGVILVVLVLLFFLGLRNSLFVGIAIPVSMFMAFMILGAGGVTLNIMVLFSLILALGMLVDNGIVVVENIYRLMGEGLSPIEAAKQGAGEVAWPIIASTATTLAAFLPLIFWPGMMGEFMGYLPITLMIVLGSSLFVGLVINPVLTATFMKLKEQKGELKTKKLLTAGVLLLLSAIFLGGAANGPAEMATFMTIVGLGPFLFGWLRTFFRYIFATPDSDRKVIIVPAVFLIAFGLLHVLMGAKAPGNLLWISGLFLPFNIYVLTPLSQKFQQSFFPRLEASYERSLKFALDRPKTFFFGTIGLFVVSVMIMGAFPLKVLFFPENMPKYVNVFIEKPVGTDIEETNKTTKQVEEIVAGIISEYKDEETGENYLIESMIAQVGEGTSDPAQGPVMGNTPHKGRVQISFVEFKLRRGVQTKDVLTDVREAIKGIPGVRITADKDAAGPPMPKPINIEVVGEEYDTLIVLAEEIKAFINSRNISGIEDLALDVELGKPELLVQVDRMKARRLNLSTGQIGGAIRTALFGKDISTYKEGEDDYDIVLRFNKEQQYDLQTILDQKITFRDPSNGQISQVPISAVAEPVKSSTFSAVKRKNLDRVITLSSNVQEGANPNEVVAAIQASMKGYPTPLGYDVKFTGQQEEQAKEMSFLSKALMIAVFLIFLIMVMQFNSAGTPFVIMASVFFSLIGVLLGLVIFQMEFVIIMTMIGLISLAGVVVNNAIVLIDYTNLIMERRRKELGLQEGQLLSMEEVVSAIVQGGKTRLRPVLLTAITTVLGLMPLATGMNINFYTLLSDFNPHIFFGGDNVIFWGPMSWTVIFGLTFATFLTLVIVPVMYYMKTRMKFRMLAKRAA